MFSEIPLVRDTIFEMPPVGDTVSEGLARSTLTRVYPALVP